MPELPEVETVRQVLKRQVLNKKIIKVDVFYEKIIANCSANEFSLQLMNQTILDVQRKGKFLIFVLDHGYLLSHLRMEGKYWFDLNLLDKHAHIVFYFSDGKVLIYHDTRKFGRMYYFQKEVDIHQQYPLLNLGMEPFEIQNGQILFEKFMKTKKCIKEVLLDQKIMAGIGNIYADEICFKAKIHPLTLANKLTKKQCETLLNASKEILMKAIKEGGSTIKTYQSAHGVDGKFQNELMVYNHANEPCKICGHSIKKIKIGGRGSSYCPYCQRKR